MDSIARSAYAPRCKAPMEEKNNVANRNFSIAHDVSRVFKCLTNPDYILARSKAMGELDASCKIAREGDRTSLHITRTVCHEADKLPKLMRRFGLRQTVVIDEQWWDDGEGKAGRFHARPGNLPIELEADLAITPTSTGSELSITQRCRVHVPLIGSTLEPLMLEQRQKDLDQEVAYLREALA